MLKLLENQTSIYMSLVGVHDNKNFIRLLVCFSYNKNKNKPLKWIDLNFEKKYDCYDVI